jgi:hypothetical protein
MCRHTPVCPHTTVHVSSYYNICVLMLLYVSSTPFICVRIQLHMCYHAATSAENCRAHGFERVYAPQEAEAESAGRGSSASGLEAWANAVLQAMSQNK